MSTVVCSIYLKSISPNIAKQVYKYNVYNYACCDKSCSAGENSKLETMHGEYIKVHGECEDHYIEDCL